MNKLQLLAKLTEQPECSLVRYIIELTKQTSLNEIRPVIDELLDIERTPSIREQRYGVLLAAWFKYTEALTSCLFNEHSLISTTAVDYITKVVTEKNQLFDIVFNENLAPAVKRLILSKIKHRRRDLIVELVQQKKLSTAEATDLLAHLPSRSQVKSNTPSENEKTIAHLLLNELMVNDISSFGPFVNRHPYVLIMFLEKQLENLKRNNSTYNEHLVAATAIFQQFQQLIVRLAKQRSDLVLKLLNEWFVEPAKQNKSEVKILSGITTLSHYLALHDDQFTQLVVDTITNNGKLLFSFDYRVLRKMKVTNWIKIWRAVQSHVNYESNSSANLLIKRFLIHIPRKRRTDAEMSRQFYEAIINDSDNFATWIADNIDNINVLNDLEPSVGSLVAQVLLKREEATTSFTSPTEETKYWKYIVDYVSDEEKFKLFKSKTSHPNPDIRADIVGHLTFCCLYHNKRVDELLQFLVNKLKNEAQQAHSAFYSVFDGSQLKVTRPNFLRHMLLDKKNRDAFNQIFVNSAQNSIYNCQAVPATIITDFSKNPEILTFAFNLVFGKNTISLSRGFLSIKDPLVLEILFTKFKTDLNKLSVPDQVKEIQGLFMFITNKNRNIWNIEAVREFITDLFLDKIPQYIKKSDGQWNNGSDDRSDVINLFDLWISKMIVGREEKLKLINTILDQDASYIVTKSVQQVIFGSRYPLSKELQEKYVQPKPLTYNDLKDLSTTTSALAAQNSETRYFHFNPFVLRLSRAERYLSQDISRTLIEMLKESAYQISKDPNAQVNTKTTAYITTHGMLENTYNIQAHVKWILKYVGRLAIEHEEREILDAFIQKFSETKGNETSKVESEKQTEQNDADNIAEEEEQEARSDTTNISAQLITYAYTVKTYYPSEHLSQVDYLLENIRAESVIDFISGLNKLSQWIPANKVFDHLLEKLKLKMSNLSNTTAATALPLNFTVTIQKSFMSLLVLLVENIANSTQKLVKFLCEVWKYDLHRDVRCKIVSIMHRLLKASRTEYELEQFSSCLTSALESDYPSLVLEAFGVDQYCGDSVKQYRNNNVAQKLFDIQIHALDTKHTSIEESTWQQLSTLLSSKLFVATQTCNPEHNFYDKLSKYTAGAIVTFNPKLQHNVASSATDVLLKVLLAKPLKSKVIYEQVIVPLFTSTELQALDEQYDAVDESWDLPVSKRRYTFVLDLVKSVEMSYIENEISNNDYQSIIDSLFNPLRDIILKKSSTLYFASYYMLSLVGTEWKNIDSVVNSIISLSADIQKNSPTDLVYGHALKVCEQLPNYVANLMDDMWDKVAKLVPLLIKQDNEPIVQLMAMSLIHAAGERLKWPKYCRLSLKQLRQTAQRYSILQLVDKSIQ
jgi:hypothetical protein